MATKEEAIKQFTQSVFDHKVFVPMELIDDNGLSIDDRDSHGNTLLLIAVFAKNEVLARYLVECGADVNAHNESGWTPLRRSVVRDQIPLIELFSSHQANLEEADKSGKTPLFFVRSKAAAQLLIDHGADVNARDARQMTPLFRAVNEEIAALLVEKGAQINARDIYGQTPLFRAENAGVAKVLLDNGADVNAVNVDGNTPLFPAEDKAVVETLVAYGANVNAVNHSGWTPLMVAAYCGRADVAETLVNLGADLSLRNARGESALDLAKMFAAQHEGDPAAKHIVALLKSGPNASNGGLFNFRDNSQNSR